jgi:cytochrome c oxidase cbb3-type subunit 3
MSAGWSLFVIALVLINVLGALWLLWWTRRGDAAEPETTGHVWDGDLTEYNKPLPRWWLWLFLITVVFSAAYLVLYPGFGSYAGRLGWSQLRQHEEQVAAAEQSFAARFGRFAAMDISALSRDPEAMAAARNLFANNCTTCHGSDARGAVGFPNLTDDDWLYGGDPATLELTIGQGRHGVMPPWGEALGSSGVEAVIAYTLSLSRSDLPEDMVAAGKASFETLCATCHGADARGNPQFGAPNLSDDIWLYGDSPDSLRQTISKGRSNQMPAHLPLLGELKVRMLAAYVMTLSQADGGSAGAAAAH